MRDKGLLKGITALRQLSILHNEQFFALRSATLLEVPFSFSRRHFICVGVELQCTSMNILTTTYSDSFKKKTLLVRALLADDQSEIISQQIIFLSLFIEKKKSKKSESRQ